MTIELEPPAWGAQEDPHDHIMVVRGEELWLHLPEDGIIEGTDFEDVNKLLDGSGCLATAVVVRAGHDGVWKAHIALDGPPTPAAEERFRNQGYNVSHELPEFPPELPLAI